MKRKYLRLPSRHLNKRVHLWIYGHGGQPVLVFPSAAGMAHEWEHAGAIDALRPWIEQGRIQLFCPESNVSEAWTGEGSADWRLNRHRAYEQFVTDELVPFIWHLSNRGPSRLFTAGCSFGAFYAANLALKNPELVSWALCMSGRYRTDCFFEGFYDDRVYYADPLRYVPNLHGDWLQRVRQTSLTLVVGQGNFEGRCIEETRDLAMVLHQKRIPCEPDFWGDDVSHEWMWWQRQLLHHLRRRLL